jgi:hypothetical protein
MFRFRLYKTRKQPEPNEDEDLSDEGDQEYDYHVSQVFMGHHSIITLAGFTVGGILVGRGLYEVLVRATDVRTTIIIGLLMFAVTGLYIGSFKG